MPVLLDVATAAQLDALKIVGAIAAALAGVGRLLGWMVEVRKQRAIAAVPASSPTQLPPWPSLTAQAPAAPDPAEWRIKRAEWEADRARLNWRLEEARRQIMIANREVEKLQDALTSERSARARVEHMLKHERKRAKTVDGIQDVTDLVLPDEAEPTWRIDAGELLATPIRPPAPRKLVPL